MTVPDTPPAHAVTFAGLHRPVPVRLANLVGRRFESTVRRLVPLSVESVVRAAERDAGVTDPGDELIREPLERLLASVDAEAQLNAVGRWWLRIEMIASMSKRLRVREHLRRHPEILDVPVERPVFIIGFPRTGSTLLQRLMALDPGNRVPRLWELLNPVPLGPTRRGQDPRMREAERYLRWVRRMSPPALQMHPMAAEAPEECRFLLSTSFVGPQHMYCDVPSYTDWFWGLPDDRLEAVCRELRTQIQILTHGDEHLRWVGKDPTHSAFGRGFIRTFPDARVVVLHRDPAESVPSLCSLGAVSRSIFTDHVDLHAIGQEVLRGFVLSMDRMMDMRDMPTAASFHDVRYDELVTDPIGTVRAIYAFAGMPFTRELESRIEQDLAPSSRHGKGPHQYSAEQFGLSREEIWAGAEHYLRWLERLGR